MSHDPLTPLEVACGMPLGGDAPVRLPPAAGADPLRALEAATLPALEAAPCRVAFSGGLDSSVVLAAATRMARRAGLPPPIPVTLRFAGVPSTHEDGWQELVVRDLGLADWERVELTDELDLLGDAAVALLRRVGPYWPANAHLVDLLLRRSARGSLLTGEGGDDLFAWSRWARASAVLGRRRRVRARDAAAVALALSPRTVRRMHDRRARTPAPPPWLRPGARRAYAREVAGWADAPWRFDRLLAWIRARGSVTVSLALLDRLAADAGAVARAPLLDAGFLAALAAAGGRSGWGGRRATWAAVFGTALPAPLLDRRDKATFNDVFWGPRARAFAEGWGGSGLDGDLVDPAAVREAWRAGDWRSADLLQRAYLLEIGAATWHTGVP